MGVLLAKSTALKPLSQPFFLIFHCHGFKCVPVLFQAEARAFNHFRPLVPQIQWRPLPLQPFNPVPIALIRVKGQKPFGHLYPYGSMSHCFVYFLRKRNQLCLRQATTINLLSAIKVIELAKIAMTAFNVNCGGFPTSIIQGTLYIHWLIPMPLEFQFKGKVGLCLSGYQLGS